ncbi:helix-turn-helix domain-containing protein [Photobacterium indicum]|uniref:helix-turn-helix domain-containing protein n=1 Tax=Photobacterium indicum TaxID=81447 RepID=UPI003D13E150
MKTWMHQPRNIDVSHYVDRYWWLEVGESDSGYEPALLIPNPNANLIFTLPTQQYSYQQEQQELVGQGSHLLHLCSKAISINDQGSIIRLGIKFKAGALYALFGIEGSETQNTVTSDLSLLHPSFTLANIRQLIDTDYASDKEADQIKYSVDNVIERLDNLFSQVIQLAKEDRHSILVRDALSLLADNSSVGIETKLFCSRRTLERAFLRVTGVSIKQYEMMMRLDAVLMYIFKNLTDPKNDTRITEPDWADIAQYFGFSDQPHLIRQLKQAIGHTPKKYLNTRNLIIDVYGDFE